MVILRHQKHPVFFVSTMTYHSICEMPYLYNDLGSWHFLKDLTQKKTFLSYLRKRSVKTCYYCNSNMNCFPPWLGLC